MFAEACYPQQIWELEIPLRRPRFDGDYTIDELAGDFHDVHAQVLGMADRGSFIEIVSWGARVRCRLRQGLAPLAAHADQLANPRWTEEFAEWVGRTSAERDGVRIASSGPQPEPQDTWVFRDFALGHAATRAPGKDFEAEPMIAVVASYVDDPFAQVQAGA